MDLERALHKKCNQIPIVVAQRLISSMMRRCLGACGVKRRSYQVLNNDVTFEARPLLVGEPKLRIMQTQKIAPERYTAEFCIWNA